MSVTVLQRPLGMSMLCLFLVSGREARSETLIVPIVNVIRRRRVERRKRKESVAIGKNENEATETRTGIGIMRRSVGQRTRSEDAATPLRLRKNANIVNTVSIVSAASVDVGKRLHLHLLNLLLPSTFGPILRHGLRILAQTSQSPHLSQFQYLLLQLGHHRPLHEPTLRLKPALQKNLGLVDHQLRLYLLLARNGRLFRMILSLNVMSHEVENERGPLKNPMLLLLLFPSNRSLAV